MTTKNWPNKIKNDKKRLVNRQDYKSTILYVVNSTSSEKKQ